VARTYSSRFILMKSAAVSESARWTVPAGRRAVVKQMSAINNSPGAAYVMLAVEGYYVQRFNFQAIGESQSREMRLTLYAGEELICLCQQPDMRVSVDGHLFEDTAARLVDDAAARPGAPTMPVAPPDVVGP
jgi:hypothetical protein